MAFLSDLFLNSNNSKIRQDLVYLLLLAGLVSDQSNCINPPAHSQASYYEGSGNICYIYKQKYVLLANITKTL